MANRALIHASQREGKIDVTVEELIFVNFVHNCYTRKLVNESHGIFLEAEHITEAVSESIKEQTLMKISRKYHSVLIACMEDLDKATATPQLSEEDIFIQKTMFSDIELVWSLVEVLLNGQSRGIVVYQLLAWIQWHFIEPSKNSAIIMEMGDPCNHPSYWDTIFQFVLQGNISAARALLKLHDSSAREDFLSMDELLRKMPMYSATPDMSWNEFLMRWNHWQDECRRRTKQSEFSTIDQLDTLAEILCGNKDVLGEKSILCGTWYNFLVAVLLFSDPCITFGNLGLLARSYFNNMSTEPILLDQTILSVLELDIMGMIKQFSLFNDGSWFVTHMTDIFHRSNFWSDDSSSIPSLREDFIFSYATTLMSHVSLWQIGIDYLDRCENNGRIYVELCLERIPLTTEIKARKVLYLAKKRHLEELAQGVCKMMARKAIDNKMFGTALSWVIESKDVRFATDLANRWIKEYSETGKFHCFEILKNLGFCMLVSDKLTFLGKYCEFHKLYQDKEFKDAASLLVSLLSSGLVPKPFQMVMLLDALPLLEHNEPVFTMKETTQLLACLEGLSSINSNMEQKTDLKTKERLIRLALARNLSRTFLHENSIFPTIND